MTSIDCTKAAHVKTAKEDDSLLVNFHLKLNLNRHFLVQLESNRQAPKELDESRVDRRIERVEMVASWKPERDNECCAVLP
jgi:hypothetical protein